MKNGSYFVPREQLAPFMNPGAMNNEEGLYLNWIAGITTLAEFEGDEADGLFSYLFAGRWDHSTLVKGRHQIYGGF